MCSLPFWDGFSLRFVSRPLGVQKPSPRTAFHNLDGLCIDNSVYIMGHNKRNLEEAIMSRVLFTKNKGGWVKRRAKRYGFDNKLKTFFHDLTAGVVKGFPFTYEQFLLQCNARKRDLYVRAVESILDIPLNGKDYVRKAFVKV